MQDLVQTVNFKLLTEKKLDEMGWVPRDLQERLGIPERTYYRRLKEPGRMSVSQMRQWADALHFTDQERLDVIRKILR